MSICVCQATLTPADAATHAELVARLHEQAALRAALISFGADVKTLRVRLERLRRRSVDLMATQAGQRSACLKVCVEFHDNSWTTTHMDLLLPCQADDRQRERSRSRSPRGGMDPNDGGDQATCADGATC